MSSDVKTFVVVLLWCVVVQIVFYTYFWHKQKTNQSTWVYCPGCKRELVSADNRIVVDTDLVRYYCGDCFTMSEWNFDFPVPVHLASRRFDLRVTKGETR